MPHVALANGARSAEVSFGASSSLADGAQLRMGNGNGSSFSAATPFRRHLEQLESCLEPKSTFQLLGELASSEIGRRMSTVHVFIHCLI